MKIDYVVLNKRTVSIDSKAQIGKNVIIYENNRIDGNCVIEDNVPLFPNCFISDSIIGKGAKIYTSVIEKSEIGACSSIGPFSHLKNSKLEPHTKVGAFCSLRGFSSDKTLTIEPFTDFQENVKLKNKCIDKKQGNADVKSGKRQ